MRLESTTTSAPVLLSCALLALGACGDDGGATTGGAATGSTTEAAATDNPSTSNSSVDSTGGGMNESTADPSTSGLDTTGGSGPGPDTDDGTTTNGGGDCAGMSFSMLTSTENDLLTNLDVAGLVSCNLEITITATGGTVCAVDDGAGGFDYTVETIALMDVPPVTCGLAEVGLTNLSIQNTGDGMEVTVPQAGGPMAGNQSISVLGDVEGTALNMPVGPVALTDFNGVLPEGDVEFGGGDTTVTYADNSTVIATSMPEVIPGVAVTVTLTGLTGSLTFAM
ncbi:MAG: hypothetical protein K0V04_37225 [Deltaproteobacteria bacterium]|nr:hypothetical protein [Deltaproteobacteria bacterium]